MSGWRPNCGTEVAAQRSQMLDRTRHYFSAQAVLHVDTPTLGATGVTDPQIDSLPEPVIAGRAAADLRVVRLAAKRRVDDEREAEESPQRDKLLHVAFIHVPAVAVSARAG